MNDERKILRRNIYKLRRIVLLLTAYSILISIILVKMLITQGNQETPDVNVFETKTVSAEVLPQPLKSETYIATAYCPCKKCCGKTDGITKIGTKAKEGRTIAVDPKIIPLGSKVIIDGHEYIAEDIGGAVKGNKVDIYFDSHSEALKFGRKTVNLTVIENDGV